MQCYSVLLTWGFNNKDEFFLIDREYNNYSGWELGIGVSFYSLLSAVTEWRWDWPRKLNCANSLLIKIIKYGFALKNNTILLNNVY